MLKLYYHCAVMVNDNISVEQGLSNGTMAKFIGVELVDDVTFEHLEKISIDGYYVWCANASQVKGIKLQLLDGMSKNGEEKTCLIPPREIKASAKIPLPLDGRVSKHTHRHWKDCSFKGFPLNIAHARTIHKLQGRSLQYEVISSWQYQDNWIYVALSRVRTLKGLFLRRRLEFELLNPPSEELKRFMARLRQPGKKPNPPPQIYE